MDKIRGGGQKMSVFVHPQGIKTVHTGGGVKKWPNSIQVVVECPLSKFECLGTYLLPLQYVFRLKNLPKSAFNVCIEV